MYAGKKIRIIFYTIGKKAARIIYLENLTKKEKREKSCKKRIEILHDNAHTHK